MADKKEETKNEDSRLLQRNFSPAHLIVIGVVAVLFTVAVTNYLTPASPTGKVVYLPTPTTEEPTVTAVISAEEATTMATDLIKTDLVPEGVEVDITEVSEEGDLYKMLIVLTQNGQESQLYAYMTKDGKYFLPSVFDVETDSFLEQAPAVETTTNTQPSTFDAPDAETPVVKFFVMAFCPFGQQAEQGLKPAYELLKDSVTFEPHYVVYENYGGGGPDYCIEDGKYCSMHGVTELNEDIRQLCIYKYEDTDTFWNYLEAVWTDCTNSDIDTCWKTAAEKTGVDIAKVESCFDNEGVDLIAAEQAADAEYGVSGSPSVFINDQSYSGGRAPDNYKTGICTGFTETPSECDTELEGASNTANGSC